MLSHTRRDVVFRQVIGALPWEYFAAQHFEAFKTVTDMTVQE